MKNIEIVKPNALCTNYIYKAIPLAFDESLSYYEVLAGLLDYLRETIIPAVNNNGLAVIELQNLYLDLKNYVDNYFDNLDISEELSEKIKDLINSGAILLNLTAIYDSETKELTLALTGEENENA